MLAAFFFGKSINENLDAWKDIASKIRALFTKKTTLGRHGAGIVAIEAVFHEMQGIPKSIKLLSYRAGFIADSNDLAAMPPSTDIADNPPTLNLGFVRHIFEIEADGEKFRVSVDGGDTKLLRF